MMLLHDPDKRLSPRLPLLLNPKIRFFENCLPFTQNTFPLTSPIKLVNAHNRKNFQAQSYIKKLLLPMTKSCLFFDLRSPIHIIVFFLIGLNKDISNSRSGNIDMSLVLAWQHNDFVACPHSILRVLTYYTGSRT